MYGLKPVPFMLKPLPFMLKPLPFMLKALPFMLKPLPFMLKALPSSLAESSAMFSVYFRWADGFVFAAGQGFPAQRAPVMPFPSVIE
jgi:hypothetical protein